MPRFRRIPEVIEAIQWFPGKTVHGVVESDRQIGNFYAHAWITSKEGVKAVNPGDWIIMGAGEEPPIPDRVFKTMYEPAFDTQAVLDDIDVEIPEPTAATGVSTETLILRSR